MIFDNFFQIGYNLDNRGKLEVIIQTKGVLTMFYLLVVVIVIDLVLIGQASQAVGQTTTVLTS